jgi:hypothetical protein
MALQWLWIVLMERKKNNSDQLHFLFSIRPWIWSYLFLINDDREASWITISVRCCLSSFLTVLWLIDVLLACSIVLAQQVGNSWRCLRVITVSNISKITEFVYTPSLAENLIWSPIYSPLEHHSLGATCHPRNAYSNKAWPYPWRDASRKGQYARQRKDHDTDWYNKFNHASIRSPFFW